MLQGRTIKTFFVFLVFFCFCLIDKCLAHILMHKCHDLVQYLIRQHIKHANVAYCVIASCACNVNAAIQHQLTPSRLNNHIPQLLQRAILALAKQVKLGSQQLGQIHVLLMKTAPLDAIQLVDRDINHLHCANHHVLFYHAPDALGQQRESVAGEVGIHCLFVNLIAR